MKTTKDVPFAIRHKREERIALFGFLLFDVLGMMFLVWTTGAFN